MCRWNDIRAVEVVAVMQVGEVWVRLARHGVSLAQRSEIMARRTQIHAPDEEPFQMGEKCCLNPGKWIAHASLETIKPP